ncbi:MAG: hypothetical protein SF053_16090 [Bacteroidia bacterium]|jgi:hypothetical protein|nr:hypothetical protein [Bacteroidia bacterium]
MKKLLTALQENLWQALRLLPRALLLGIPLTLIYILLVRLHNIGSNYVLDIGVYGTGYLISVVGVYLMYIIAHFTTQWYGLPPES